MRRTRRFTVGFISFLLFLVASLVIGTGVFVVPRAFPQIRGTLAVPGLHAPVEVIRDQWGVPHIFAQNVHDLFFAQGYVHAQDRLWQMEFNRRAASGRLSEILGERTLSADRFVRTIGLRRAAEREYARLEPEAREVLEGYTAGVNAFLVQHANRLPIEFALLRVHPEPWSSVDTLAFAKLMSWILSFNWRSELLRAHLVSRFGVEGMRFLIPTYPNDAPVIVPPEADSRLRPTRALLPLLDADAARPGGGSNNWVVSGRRTATGAPILANDPHLEAQMPSVWYEMHLEGGPYQVMGSTLPGAPGVIIGHNAEIAWGMTAAIAAVQDLYIERFDPTDPTRYRYQGHWESATVIREEIKIKGKRQPVVEPVRITRHGPILNNVVEGLGTFLALRWTALDPGTVVHAVLRLNRAHTWQEFRDALRLWTGPVLNFVYADRKGNIGYQLPGRIPIRSKGNGLLPVPGWTGEYEWVGEIPFAGLPSSLNPPRGYIATANNRIVSDRYAFFISAEWDPGYRAQRIETLLATMPHATLEDMKTIQLDVASLLALTFVRTLQSIHLTEEPAASLLAELQSWDGVLRADSRPAAIYEAFRVSLVPLVFKDVLGPDVYKRYLEYFPAWPTVILRLLQTPTSPWWGSAGRDTLVAQALQQADDLLVERLGADRSRWSWGRLHTMQFVHPIGRIPAFAWIFNTTAPPTGGDPFTINVGGFDVSTFGQVFVASFRQILDLADWDRSLAIHTTGQSGQPFNPHYRDFVALWATGQYHPMLFSRAQIQHAAAATLTLVPP